MCAWTQQSGKRISQTKKDNRIRDNQLTRVILSNEVMAHTFKFGTCGADRIFTQSWVIMRNVPQGVEFCCRVARHTMPVLNLFVPWWCFISGVCLLLPALDEVTVWAISELGVQYLPVDRILHEGRVEFNRLRWLGHTEINRWHDSVERENAHQIPMQ